MLKEISEAIKPREERVPFAGHELVVREMASAAELGGSAEGGDLFYHLMVASIFLADGTPALEEKDIPELKAAGKNKLVDLMTVVRRVNGLDVKGDAEKSAAGPG